MKINLLLKASQDKYQMLNRRWLIIFSAAVFLILILAASGVLAFEVKYGDKFLPGSRIGAISLEGLNRNEATRLLNQITADIETNGLKIIYLNNGAEETKIMPAVGAISDPDLSHELFSFNNAETVNRAFALGHNGNFWQNLATQAKIIFKNKNFPAVFNLNEELLKKNLVEQFGQTEQPAKNARPQITQENDRYQIEILPEENGAVIDYQKIVNDVKNNLTGLNNLPVKLQRKIESAEIKIADIINGKELIQNVLAMPTAPTFAYQDIKWLLPKKNIAEMLIFKKTEAEVGVGLADEQLEKWLGDKAGAIINVPPKDAVIEFSEGKIVKFIPHQDGREIDYAQTNRDADAMLLATDKTNIEIKIRITRPNIVTEKINDIGIKEIIGTGHSNFSGSPANRRHNIKNGASKLQGILIKPNEEFSLINALGPVDGATGYLPELVIKENKTMPEFGGGLCQIGTTVFRAAMASALPITERRNHSYNVSYYLEDGVPGTDATIYIPHPDVRFINDTGNYILIQTRVVGNDLFFDFWGTSDGRTMSRTKPKIWGWTSPPPTKYIESTDIPVGTTKCTEKSHQGVNASFDYIVVYPNGEIKKTVFSSYYKPWQAVCLVGVEKLSETATSTAEIVNPDAGN